MTRVQGNGASQTLLLRTAQPAGVRREWPLLRPLGAAGGTFALFFFFSSQLMAVARSTGQRSLAVFVNGRRVFLRILSARAVDAKRATPRLGAGQATGRAVPRCVSPVAQGAARATLLGKPCSPSQLDGWARALTLCAGPTGVSVPSKGPSTPRRGARSPPRLFPAPKQPRIGTAHHVGASAAA